MTKPNLDELSLDELNKMTAEELGNLRDYAIKEKNDLLTHKTELENEVYKISTQIDKLAIEKSEVLGKVKNAVIDIHKLQVERKQTIDTSKSFSLSKEIDDKVLEKNKLLEKMQNLLTEISRLRAEKRLPDTKLKILDNRTRQITGMIEIFKGKYFNAKA